MPSRVDGNQANIVRAIRSVPGWTWIDLTQGAYGKRCGDGLLRAGWMPPGMVLHVEIKTEKGKLKPHQEASAIDGSIVVIRSFDNVKNLMDFFYKKIDKQTRADWNGAYRSERANGQLASDPSSAD